MKTHLALPLRIPALALALAAGAHGMVTVKVSTTRPGVLDPEKPQAFFARVEGADGRNRCKWEVWENGVQVGPAQGVFLEEGAKDGSVLFSATSGAGQRSFTLRAYSKADPSASGELAVQVGHGLPPPRTALPAGVIGLIAEYADSAEGDSAMSLMADPVPSWYVEMTRQAWFPALPAHPEWASLVPVRAYGDRPYRELKINGDGRGPHIVGYGCPAFLTWEPPAGTERQILSVQPWVPGARPALQPLESKATGVEHRFTGRCTIGVETIVRSGKSWESEDIYCSPTVRGLLPVAGDPAAGPGHQDGFGFAARFSLPQGIAPLDGEDPPGWDTKAGPERLPMDRVGAVADAREHVLRIVYETGLVRTVWGKPGEAGFKDGAPGAARFNRPTFLASVYRQEEQGNSLRSVGVGLVVADTGNHAVRTVRPDGVVATLAGNGKPGYRNTDSAAEHAQFNEPRGVVWSPDGCVYVADAKNHAIRGIRGKHVFTVAGGGPDRPGDRDGAGEDARFRDLKGLALDSKAGVLYAADGHAIRKIVLGADGTTGEVTTILGCVDQAADPKAFQARMTVRPSEPLRPCLNVPQGLAWLRGSLYLADQGHNAVRRLQFLPDGAAVLETVAGDPGRDAVAFGLFRDSQARFPGAGYGTLSAPAGLAVSGGDDGPHLLVASGTCLAALNAVTWEPSGAADLRAQLEDGLAVAAPAQVKADRTFHAGIGLPEAIAPTGRPYDYLYTVAFVEADGSVGEPAQGRATFDQSPRIQGRFSRPGTATVRLRIVTPDGCSFAVERKVEVVK